LANLDQSENDFNSFLSILVGIKEARKPSTSYCPFLMNYFLVLLYTEDWGDKKTGMITR
jgi:hypothetical protein